MSSLALTRWLPAMGMLLLFIPQQQSSATVPQQSTQNPAHQKIQSEANRRFLSALTAYKAQRYEAAQAELESLAKSAPNSFEVNELLGLVYVAQGKQQD